MSIEGKTIRPIAYGGHCVFALKCESAVDLVDLPENITDGCSWVEVVALGVKAGKPCTKQHMRKFKRARCLDIPLQKGDLLLLDLPRNINVPTEGVTRLTGTDYFFIEESLPILIWRAE